MAGKNPRYAAEAIESEKYGRRRPIFGNRRLENPDAVFSRNAWDNVEWDEEQELEAKSRVELNSNEKTSTEKTRTLEECAAENWNNFYSQHQNKFFKDRKWLFTEFPELSASTSDESTATDLKILEVGCGVGNTVFPIIEHLKEFRQKFTVYCCDFSEKAVDLVRSHELCNSEHCCPFVWDITEQEENPDRIPLEPESLDIIMLIFVLSAISPAKFRIAVNNLCRYLRPGGVLLLRDYGRYDLAQLRFKSGQCIDENFYFRKDGTRVYFFTQEELDELLTSAGLEKQLNHADRRLIVNRAKQLKMYRVWLQCRYRKPKTNEKSVDAE